MKKFNSQEFVSQGGKLIVREVEKRDCKTLNSIAQEPGVIEFLELEPPISLASTIAHLNQTRKNGKWLAAELDGKVVGGAELRPKSGKEAHVAGFGIMLSSKARGKGIAEIALRELFKFAKKNGVKIIFARCFEDNARARKFYKKIGFHEVAVMKGHFRKRNRYIGSVLIEKRL